MGRDRPRAESRNGVTKATAIKFIRNAAMDPFIQKLMVHWRRRDEARQLFIVNLLRSCASQLTARLKYGLQERLVIHHQSMIF